MGYIEHTLCWQVLTWLGWWPGLWVWVCVKGIRIDWLSYSHQKWELTTVAFTSPSLGEVFSEVNQSIHLWLSPCLNMDKCMTLDKWLEFSNLGRWQVDMSLLTLIGYKEFHKPDYCDQVGSSQSIDTEWYSEPRGIEKRRFWSHTLHREPCMCYACMLAKQTELPDQSGLEDYGIFGKSNCFCLAK